MTNEELKQFTERKHADIPVVIGVSAHRNIRKEFETQIKEEVRKFIRTIKEKCSSSRIVMLNGLAEGGDQLCAQVALEEGVELTVVLPFPREEYLNDRDFSTEAKAKYYELSKNAREFVAPDTERISDKISSAEGGDKERLMRQYKFRSQAIYVATNCHILLALWDGKNPDYAPQKPSEKSGDAELKKLLQCGTGAAIEFALEHTYYSDRGDEFDSSYDGAVAWIFAPRDGSAYEDMTIKLRYRYFDPLENAQKDADEMPDIINNTLFRTDCYNRDLYLKYCAARAKNYRLFGEQKGGFLPSVLKKLFKKRYNNFAGEESRFLVGKAEYESGDVTAKSLHDVGRVASQLSGMFKKEFMFTVGYLGFCGLLLLVTFSIYDQWLALWNIWACLGVLIFTVISFVVSFFVNGGVRGKRNKAEFFDDHKKFIDYRILGETMRMQYYVYSFGLDCDVGQYFNWSHKSRSIWIRKAVKALMLGTREEQVWDKLEVGGGEEKSSGPFALGFIANESERNFKRKLLEKWIGDPVKAGRKGASVKAGKKRGRKKSDIGGQLGYHINNIAAQKDKIIRRDRLNRVAFCVTILTYFVLFLLEVLPFTDMGAQALGTEVRSVFKALLGMAAALTFVLTYYYGKQSLDMNLGDSENMVNLYRFALLRIAKIDRYDELLDDAEMNAHLDSLVAELAREFLVENGTWAAYTSDNKAELPI